MLAGRSVLQKVGTAVGSATGRPISDTQAFVMLLAVGFLVFRYILFPSGGGGSGSFFGGAEEPEGYAAYSKGYRDGQAGARFEPIVDPSASSSSSSGSSWGIGKLFNLMIAGSMLMRMAGQPPSVENFMMGLRNIGPMEGIMLFQIVSSLLF